MLFEVGGIFDPESYFEDDEQLEIVSWGFADKFKKIIYWNRGLNFAGGVTVVLIAYYGYEYVRSIYLE